MDSYVVERMITDILAPLIPPLIGVCFALIAIFFIYHKSKSLVK